MKVLIIFLSLSLVLFSVSGKSFNNVARIIGGSPAAFGQFPWQVLSYVEFPGNSLSFSGSTLISSTRVLTAAHNWFNGTNYAVKLTVYLGSNIMGEGLSIVATKVVIHEEYDTRLILNDIAIGYLPYAVQFTDNIQPASLPFGPEVNDDFADSDAVATGFGVTEDYVPPGHLRYVNVKIMSNGNCMQDLGAAGTYVRPTNICSSGEGRVGICTGDSGGPLVVYRNDQAYVVGITSFGSSIGCHESFPSVFTRVTSYKTWVEKHL